MPDAAFGAPPVPLELVPVPVLVTLPVLAPPPVLVLPTPPLPPCAEELLDDAPPAPLVVEEPLLSPLEQAAVAAAVRHTSKAAAQERGEAEFIIAAILRRNRQRTRGFLGPFKPFGAIAGL